MAEKRVRIGIVGAGANTRDRHIPGFRSIAGVEIAGVVNSTPESSARAAQEFGIPKTYPSWKALVEDADIDAVCIGTWPNLHCDVTCAALASGKHVLTEARMARNADEAKKMLAASKAHPQLVAQVVPSPFGLIQDRFVQKLINDGYLDQLREVVVIGAADMFWDYSKSLHWRQNREISGNNVLSLGILHETLLRWVPSPTRVLAQSATFEATRPDANSHRQLAVTVPECVQVLTQFAGGARGLYHFSGMELFGPGQQIHLYGRNGTIKYLAAPQEKLFVGRDGDKELIEVQVPADLRGGWRVESEFIGAIRGQEQVKYTDFAAGVRYMEFVDAVARSCETSLPVDLAP
jgi:predicted dehydrogenase